MIRQNEQQADSLEDLNLDNLVREQTPDDQPVPQQASPARVSFNETVKVRPISPRESLRSPRTGMRTNSGQEIAPQVFMDKSTPKTTKKVQLQKRIAQANRQEGLSKETKRDLVRSSFRRMHDTLQSGSGITKRKRTDDGINVIDRQNIFYVHINILQYPGNIAHCVSSDMKMGKGLALKLNRTYPNMKQACKLHSCVDWVFNFLLCTTREQTYP